MIKAWIIAVHAFILNLSTSLFEINHAYKLFQLPNQVQYYTDSQ